MPEEYTSYGGEFVNMLAPFVSIWNVHLRRVSSFKRRVELESQIVHLIHPVPYRAGSKAGDCEKSEVENMLVVNVIEPAQTE